MRIGVFSDAHGHLEAFDRAVDLLYAQGCDRLMFLGDSVGYLPTIDVLRRLRASPDIGVVRGNHEQMLIEGGIDVERDAVYRLAEVERQLEPADRAFMAKVPDRWEEVMGDWRCLFVHGSPTDPTFGYVYPDTDLAPFADVEADVIFMGHTHRPFIRPHDGKLFVNVGSCGLPRDDDPRGAVCLFDSDTGEAVILRFDIADASRRALERYDLHDATAAALRR